ncbi:MAG: transposase [Candidatus Symbiodolus clandestinus]
MNQEQLRNYDKEFKLNAVKLYHSSGKTCCQLGKELGISKTTLSGWVRRYQRDGAEAFPGKGNLKVSEAENIQLRKELAAVREERDILKKALSIFSVARK